MKESVTFPINGVKSERSVALEPSIAFVPSIPTEALVTPTWTIFVPTVAPTAQLHNLWQPGSLSATKWRENEKIKRKWRENEEMERYSFYTFSHFFFISSLSIHFLYQKLSHIVANVTKNLTNGL